MISHTDTVQELHLRDRAMAAARNGIVISDPHQPDNPLIYFNPAFQEMTGYEAEEILGHNCRFLQGPDTDPGAVETIRRSLRTESACHVVLKNYRKDGTPFWNELTLSPVRDDAGRLTHYVGIQMDISARIALEEEERRLFLGTQAQAARENLINRIGQAIRNTLDPAQIQATATALLGGALAADRCYFVTYQLARDHIFVGEDWHRPDLASLAGEYSGAEYAPFLETLFGRNATVVLPDVQEAAPGPARSVLGAFGLRAVLAVPLFVGGTLTAALFAAMTDSARTWTADDVALAEAAAVQTRLAIETAQVRRREQAIASQLQAALQPPLPGTVPGLDLVEHYKPAWEEAAVGGDFFDVFPVEKGCHALVVGDVSGKGLAAAAQVAMVRNMLRATLYLEQTLTSAVTRLSGMLTEHALLSGFVTLFVGVWDPGAGAMTYVNCGQEPALLCRAATGDVEPLEPTGPILGAFGGPAFTQQTAPVAPGDTLAIFTDGLTEAGPSRTTLLGIDGVARFLQDAVRAGGGAVDVKTRLIARVDAYARGGVRDDVCLLLGRCR